MKKYSAIKKVGKRQFRYNYEDSNLEWVKKPTKEELEEIKDDAENCKLGWMKAEAIENLKSIEETGYMVIDKIGLNKDNWKGNNQYWCLEYSSRISSELAFLEYSVG